MQKFCIYVVSTCITKLIYFPFKTYRGFWYFLQVEQDFHTVSICLHGRYSKSHTEDHQFAPSHKVVRRLYNLQVPFFETWTTEGLTSVMYLSYDCNKKFK